MKILLHNQDYLGVKEHSTVVHKITKITTLRDILAWPYSSNANNTLEMS